MKCWRSAFAMERALFHLTGFDVSRGAGRGRRLHMPLFPPLTGSLVGIGGSGDL